MALLICMGSKTIYDLSNFCMILYKSIYKKFANKMPVNNYLYFMHSSPQSTALFDNASMGIIVVNSNGLMELINPFGMRLFGYENNEVTGQPVEMLLPPRYHNRPTNHRDKYIQHPHNRPMGL